MRPDTNTHRGFIHAAQSVCLHTVCHEDLSLTHTHTHTGSRELQETNPDVQDVRQKICDEMLNYQFISRETADVKINQYIKNPECRLRA